MATEEITINGERITTLRELLRPELKAIFVGLNPSPRSVERAHYYQGAHGRRFWKLLEEHHICFNLPRGGEDDAAFEQGFGFADLVRRPTKNGTPITMKEKSEAVAGLIGRLKSIPGRPVIIFRYKAPWKLAEGPLKNLGYSVERMPGPYEPRQRVHEMMIKVKARLRSVA